MMIAVLYLSILCLIIFGWNYIQVKFQAERKESQWSIDPETSIKRCETNFVKTGTILFDKEKIRHLFQHSRPIPDQNGSYRLHISEGDVNKILSKCCIIKPNRFDKQIFSFDHALSKEVQESINRHEWIFADSEQWYSSKDLVEQSSSLPPEIDLVKAGLVEELERLNDQELSHKVYKEGRI
ncbi:hypothetical protein [Persicobacter diffluens]|uniref:Uncharacterized protein n=1 Tax=Persicobacter diffluens TaxID=981 RepID=A0AAN5AN14_9BACT|nr:hypothetical protein PEDI_55860 [Persicobacter diffluens]